MSIIWVIVPPWLFAVVVSLIGRWGDRFFTHQHAKRTPAAGWVALINLLFSTLLFLAVLPASVLALFGPLLPFTGAQAGLAIAVAVMFFGLVPARLLDATRTGWDFAFWALFIDFIRVGGSLTLVGWLLSK